MARQSKSRAAACVTAGDGTALGSACPFCKTMLTDSLADLNREQVAQFDIAEVLWKSVASET